MKLKTSHYFNLSIVLFSFFAFGWLLYPYFTVIILAIITAYYFYPIFKRFHGKFARKQWLSLLSTWLIIILVVIVPLIIISTLLLNETGNIIADLSNSKFRETSIASVNSLFDKISLSQFQVDSDQTKQVLIDTATQILNTGTSLAVSISNSLVTFITSFILYLFVTSSLISKHKNIINYIKKLLPVESKTVDIYLHHLSRVGSAMILGTFVIAIVQGILTALSFSVVGIPYFTFFAFVATLLAVIPMIGTSFLAIPAGIILILTGQIWGGIGLILFNQLIINNIDNLLRPKLVDASAKIDDVLLILAVFGGMYRRGMFGILYGPVLMSFIVTTFEIYRQAKQ